MILINNGLNQSQPETLRQLYLIVHHRLKWFLFHLLRYVNMRVNYSNDLKSSRQYVMLNVWTLPNLTF